MYIIYQLWHVCEFLFLFLVLLMSYKGLNPYLLLTPDLKILMKTGAQLSNLYNKGMMSWYLDCCPDKSVTVLNTFWRAASIHFDQQIFIKQDLWEEGSYLSSNRNSPKSEWIENAPLAILISTEQFNSMLALGSSGENVYRFGAFLSTVLFAHRPP